jgi:predicted RNA binding protein YcfA (HicA-like mRNA interferase family)
VAKKVREVIFIIESHGWVLVRHSGSHRQYRHAGSAAVVTVAGKPSSTMTVGQLANIRRLTGIKELR